MTKDSKAAELFKLLLLASKRRNDPRLLDQDWEDQVMARVLSQETTASPPQPPGDATLVTYLPHLSTFGALTAGLTLIACYKLNAIDAHILKATVETTFNFSTSLLPPLL